MSNSKTNIFYFMVNNNVAAGPVDENSIFRHVSSTSFLVLLEKKEILLERQGNMCFSKGVVDDTVYKTRFCRPN